MVETSDGWSISNILTVNPTLASSMLEGKYDSRVSFQKIGEKNVTVCTHFIL